MPIIDIYALCQIIAAVIASCIVWRRDNHHKAAALALLLWFFLSMFSQSVTGQYSPALLSFVIAAFMSQCFLMIGYASKDLWPYIISTLLITTMALDLLYWSATRAVGAPVMQGHYQNAGAIVFYMCLFCLIAHKWSPKYVFRHS